MDAQNNKKINDIQIAGASQIDYKKIAKQLELQCTAALADPIRHLSALESQIANKEDELKALRAEHRYYTEFVLPETMFFYGVGETKKFSFTDTNPIGFTFQNVLTAPVTKQCNGVVLETDIHVSIPESNPCQELIRKLISMGEGNHIRDRRQWTINSRSLKRIVRDSIANGIMSISDWQNINVNIHEYQKINVKKIRKR